ncbi:hypothetical protein HKBW3S44_00838 [Candidatus Hakubella thermalkaliphila]|uniref:Uncharacterized protein n=1 Tax=Candidatus Hakubella thermalkaliphila TaxID=2754717 RepID=A0A6V8PXF3_9ACTN|nr:hypothetical protein HKBW3S44_00838 [Candidatus Hakubella thermalkaliphila]
MGLANRPTEIRPTVEKKRAVEKRKRKIKAVLWMCGDLRDPGGSVSPVLLSGVKPDVFGSPKHQEAGRFPLILESDPPPFHLFQHH